MIKSNKDIIEGYLNQSNWKVKENSNSPFSYGGLGKHIITEYSKQYWLEEVYTKEIRDMHNAGTVHIHDLGCLTLYCCGFSLGNILATGVKGLINVPTSNPAAHFYSALNQVANLATIFQNEIAGK